jgi:hypothetical protein
MADSIQERYTRDFKSGDVSRGEILISYDYDYLTSSFTWTENNLTNDSSGEVIIVVNWIDAAGYFENVGTDRISLQIMNKLAEKPDLLSLPVHLIGHSRGGSVISGLADEFARQGIWIDHLTLLDPHPMSIDNPVHVGDRVLFSDSYFQKSSIISGMDVDGAYNIQLDARCPGLFLCPLNGGYDSSHSDIHLWYHGTINYWDNPVKNGDSEDGKDIELNNEMRASWYSSSNPDEIGGQKTGFYYSRLGGGNRKDSRAIQGYHNAKSFGGNGNRPSYVSDLSNAVWPNLVEIEVRNNSNGQLVKRTDTVEIGDFLQIKYVGQDYDGGIYDGKSRVELFLDRDRNPLNNNNICSLISFDHPASGNDTFSSNCGFDTTGLEKTDGYIYGKISDGIRTRYLYYEEQIRFVDNASSLLIETMPGDKNLKIVIDGVTVTNSAAYTWANDSSHTLNAPSPQTGTDGQQYIFDGWSDGFPQNHTITVSADINLTAYFRPTFDGQRITPVEDTYIATSDINDNLNHHYTESTIRIALDSYGLMKFQMYAIPQGSTIKQAVLVLHPKTVTGSCPVQIELRKIYGSWDQDIVVWHHTSPFIGSTVLGTFVYADINGREDIVFKSTEFPALADTLQEWLDDESTNRGFLLRTITNGLVSIGSFDGLDSSQPELYVTYINNTNPGYATIVLDVQTGSCGGNVHVTARFKEAATGIDLQLDPVSFQLSPSNLGLILSTDPKTDNYGRADCFIKPLDNGLAQLKVTYNDSGDSITQAIDLCVTEPPALVAYKNLGVSGIDVDWNSTGSLVAFASGNSLILVQNPLSDHSIWVSKEMENPGGLNNAHGVVFSPDGTRVFFAGQGYVNSDRHEESVVYQLNYPDGIPSRIWRQNFDGTILDRCVDWRGNVIVTGIGAAEDNIVGWNAANGSIVCEPTIFPSSYARGLAINPANSAQCAVVSGDTLFSYSLMNCSLLDTAYGSDGESAAWSPDGQFFAIGERNGKLAIFNQSFQSVTTLMGHTAAIKDMDFSANSLFLVTCDSGKSNVYEKVGGNWVRRRSGPGGIAVAWDPSGTHYVLSTGDIVAPFDKQGPHVSDLAPVDGSITDQPEITISALITDNTAVSSAEIAANDTPAVAMTLVEGRYQQMVALNLGTNRIVITATDIYANSTLSVFTIERRIEIQAPLIQSITVEPPSGKPGTVFKVTARITDPDSGVKPGSVLLTIRKSAKEIAVLGMHDDGVNGDDIPGDGIYTALWNSSDATVGKYSCDISASDILNNVANVNDAAALVVMGTTTSQSWQFTSNANPAYPDESSNPYGDPFVEMVGEFSSGIPWLAEDGSHAGVWIVDHWAGTDMAVSVPSRPDQNQRILFQIVYSAPEGNAPMVYFVSDDSPNICLQMMVLVGQNRMDENYCVATYQNVSPPSGKIWIRPRDYQVFVDSIYVQTECTTDPISSSGSGGGDIIEGDRNPAPFRGGPGTTFQAWSFSTGDNPIIPDLFVSPYGLPWVDLFGGFDANIVWLDNDNGHQGVWTVDSSNYINEMVASVPIYQGQTQYHQIWLQITYSTLSRPMLYVSPDADTYLAMNMIMSVQIEPYYSMAVYAMTLQQQSQYIQFHIRGRESPVYVDSIIIETQSIPIPEPILGDFDSNRIVDIDDLIILTNQWLQPPGEPSADLVPDENNIVNLLDLAVFSENWLLVSN